MSNFTGRASICGTAKDCKSIESSLALLPWSRSLGYELAHIWGNIFCWDKCWQFHFIYKGSFNARKRFHILLKFFHVDLLLCFLLFVFGHPLGSTFCPCLATFSRAGPSIFEFSYMCIQRFSNCLLCIPLDTTFPWNPGSCQSVFSSLDQGRPSTHNMQG